MDEIIKKIEKTIVMMGFDKVQTSLDEDYKKLSIVIDDDLIQAQAAQILPAMDHIFNLYMKKAAVPPHVIDLNYYRKERERLIVELARAAAHKATITHEPVELPPMNSYERRIVHLEISIHPELETESVGEGAERKVVIKRIVENGKSAKPARGRHHSAASEDKSEDETDDGAAHGSETGKPESR